LDIARQRKLGSQVRFVEKRFEDCDIDGPFDAVVGSSVLHHLEMPGALVKIYSLLKDDGVACFAEPNMINPQIALQKNIPFIKKMMGDSPDETAFIRWRFSKQLHMAGFDDVSTMPFDFLHPFTPEVLIKPVDAVGRFFEKIPILKEIAGSLIIVAGKRH
jgi:SAM-dependent methyltransferase